MTLLILVLHKSTDSSTSLNSTLPPHTGLVIKSAMSRYLRFLTIHALKVVSSEKPKPNAAVAATQVYKHASRWDETPFLLYLLQEP